MRVVAEELGISPSHVRRAVSSFFDSFARDARALPFDNIGRIYTRDRFDSFVRVFSVPRIGRFGPVYSRYLKWRRNEIRNIVLGKRSDYRTRMTQDDIENIAEDILSGRTPTIPRRSKSELFKQVWVFGKEGRWLAHHVIPKQ